MTSHQATVPQAAARYFSRVLPHTINFVSDIPWPQVAGYHYHPVVEQVFVPGKGWKRYSFNKRISPSWARKMRAEGITVVALRVDKHLADFSIAELVR